MAPAGLCARPLPAWRVRAAYRPRGGCAPQTNNRNVVPAWPSAGMTSSLSCHGGLIIYSGKRTNLNPLLHQLLLLALPVLFFLDIPLVVLLLALGEADFKFDEPALEVQVEWD